MTEQRVDPLWWNNSPFPRRDFVTGDRIKEHLKVWVSFDFLMDFLQRAVKDDAVLSTTGATCASVITPACSMKSAAKTMNLNAPQVSLYSPDIIKTIFLLFVQAFTDQMFY